MNPELLKRISVAAIRNDFNFKRIIVANNFVHLYSFPLMAVITAISAFFFQAPIASLVILPLWYLWFDRIQIVCPSLEEIDADKREIIQEIIKDPDIPCFPNHATPFTGIGEWFEFQTRPKKAVKKSCWLKKP